MGCGEGTPPSERGLKWGQGPFPEKRIFRLKRRVLVLKVVKHDIIWGTICIGVRTLNSGGTRPPVSTRDLRPCRERTSVQSKTLIIRITRLRLYLAERAEESGLMP